MGKRKRRSYTSEYKAEVVKLIRESDRSIGAVARDLDLTETAVHRWVQQAEIDSGEGPAGALTTAERGELAQLRKRVKTLEMECEIPKNTFCKQSCAQWQSLWQRAPNANSRRNGSHHELFHYRL